jgi:pilus assembly protein CpaF
VTVIDESLVVDLRERVARTLSDRKAEMRLGSGPSISPDDESALARSIINVELGQYAQRCATESKALLTQDEETVIAQAVYDRIFQLGRLQPLLDNPSIQNIIINGADRVIIEYADGRRESGPQIAGSDDELIELLRDVGRRFGLAEREFNPSHPSLNLQLPDGSRLFAVAWVCDRPSVAIRRHRYMELTLDDFERLGAIDGTLKRFLRAAVRARKQIIVAGATGAGKTTMLRALASEIPSDERIVTIETELELGLNRDPLRDCVALEAREANVEGVGEVSAADLVRWSLRMNPDRVIVGEVRGYEVIPMLNAMSQGNEGSMCTIHSDSSATTFNKLALYAMQAPERLPLETTNQLAAAAIDLVVWINKSRTNRFVGSVRQVVGSEGNTVITNELFAPGPDGRAVPSTPIPVDLLNDLVEVGFDAASHYSDVGGWR